MATSKLGDVVSVCVTESHPLYGKGVDFQLPITIDVLNKEYPRQMIDKETADLFKGCRLDDKSIPLSVYLLCPGGIKVTGFMQFGKEKLWLFSYIEPDREYALKNAQYLAEQLINYQLTLNYGLFTHLEYLA